MLSIEMRMAEVMCAWNTNSFEDFDWPFDLVNQTMPKCLDSWNHVLFHSWPLVKARYVLRTLNQPDFSPTFRRRNPCTPKPELRT